MIHYGDITAISGYNIPASMTGLPPDNCLHCKEEYDIRDGVETDEIDLAVEPRQQPDEGAGMDGIVVESGKHDVFERQMPLVAEIVLPEQVEHLLNGIGPLDRHE